MSMHEIEGLVEDSILLLNNSKKSTQVKRELIFNLYQFQAMFDTGYTHFRVKDILQQTNYLYSITISKHPDYQEKPDKIADIEKTLEKQRSTWIDDVLCEKDKTSGKVNCFFDYGSNLWQQLVETDVISDTAKPPSQLSIIQLAYIIMQEAAEQEDNLLILQWYVMTSNCFAEEYIEEDIYKDFPTFLTDSNVIESKALALNNGIESYKERNGYLTLQLWDHVKDGIPHDKLDKHFTLRFWLDFEANDEDLLNSYKAETVILNDLNKQGIKQKKIDLIPNALKKILNEENGWTQGVSKDDEYSTQWIWYKDNKGDEKNVTDDYYRESINLKFDKDEQGLHCDLGLQLGKVLRWQKQTPNPDPAFWHFYTNLMTNFDEDKPENKNRLNTLGLWKYRLTQSEKKLSESLTAFSVYLEKESAKIFQTNIAEFNQKLFKRDSEKLMHIMEYGEDDTGIIPDYILFHSGTMIPLTFLFNAIDQVQDKDNDAINNNLQVKKYYQQFKASLDALHPKGASKQYLEPLQSLKHLTGNGMPFMLHMHFINHYRNSSN